jgi:hypothetical protein
MASQEQRFLWLSSALAQAGPASRLTAAAAWMRSEGAVIGDFSRSDTLADLASAVGLSGTEQKRLKSVIGTLIPGSDSRSLPEIEALLRDEPLEEDDSGGGDWVRASPDDPEPIRASEQNREGTSDRSGGLSVPAFLPPLGLPQDSLPQGCACANGITSGAIRPE